MASRLRIASAAKRNESEPYRGILEARRIAFFGFLRASSNMLMEIHQSLRQHPKHHYHAVRSRGYERCRKPQVQASLAQICGPSLGTEQNSASCFFLARQVGPQPRQPLVPAVEPEVVSAAARGGAQAGPQ